MNYDELTGPILTDALTLESSALYELEESIRDAATWCEIQSYPDDRNSILRSPELRPPKIDEVSECLRESGVLLNCVRHVVATRSRLLAERGVERVALDVALRTGCMIGHDGATCLDDQTPMSISGLFDELDHIGWDSWVGMIPEDTKELPYAEFYTLVAWVPGWLVLEVDRAMETSSNCLAWIPSGLVWPTRNGPRSDEPR